MNTWERKGAAAARSGRFRDMYSAWKRAKGKPKLTARDKKLGVTFNGKMVEAKEYFFSGYQSAERTNPVRSKIRGWVKARAVKIVRNKRGQAVSVKIRT